MCIPWNIYHDHLPPSAGILVLFNAGIFMCTVFIFMYWGLAYIHGGISTLRIYVIVASPHLRDRGVTRVESLSVNCNSRCETTIVHHVHWGSTISQSPLKSPAIQQSFWRSCLEDMIPLSIFFLFFIDLGIWTCMICGFAFHGVIANILTTLVSVCHITAQLRWLSSISLPWWSYGADLGSTGCFSSSKSMGSFIFGEVGDHCLRSSDVELLLHRFLERKCEHISQWMGEQAHLKSAVQRRVVCCVREEWIAPEKESIDSLPIG